LKTPDGFWSCQAHANLLTLVVARSVPEVRPRPSAGLSPVSSVPWASPNSGGTATHGGVAGATPLPIPDFPRCPENLPRVWLRLPRRPFQLRRSVAVLERIGLPRVGAGSANALVLSRPAQDSLHVAAREFARLPPLVALCPRRSRPVGYPTRPTGSYRTEPTIVRVELSSTGSPRLSWRTPTSLPANTA